MSIILIIKGFIIGLAKIIPGISGSMLAMTFNLYEEILTSITNFFSQPRKHIKFLFNFGLGLIIAIILGSKLLLYLYNHFFSETCFLFLGLIIATLIPFIKKVKFNYSNLILFLLTFFLIEFLITKVSFSTQNLQHNFLFVTTLGFIDATSSIIPALSGTTIYLILNCYDYVLSILANPLSFSFFDFAIGFIIGAILICRLMSYLLSHHQTQTYVIILSFMTSSLFTLLITLIPTFNLFNLLLFLIGFLIGLFL